MRGEQEFEIQRVIRLSVLMPDPAGLQRDVDPPGRVPQFLQSLKAIVHSSELWVFGFDEGFR
jgi:hypothetical protein